jgi:uncharacterized membrane protein YhaH (DUF805 family)
MEMFIKVFKNYANFKGRARRKEYWMFVLFHMIIVYGLMFAAAFAPFLSMVLGVYMLAALIPSLAVAVRRMHDTNKSGWFLLVPIYSFILAVSNGDVGANDHGEDPKEDNVKSDDVLDSNV